jgi:hypothetical protein
MRELKQSYPSSPDAKWGYWRVDEPVESEHESESEGQAAERSPVERSQGLEKSRELTGCRLASSTTWLCATPKLVGGPLLNKTIVHVACGAQHMACVTGTLALFLFITLLLPLLSLFQFLFLWHRLTITSCTTDEGDVFTWGYGGTSTETKQTTSTLRVLCGVANHNRMLLHTFGDRSRSAWPSQHQDHRGAHASRVLS